MPINQERRNILVTIWLAAGMLILWILLPVAGFYWIGKPDSVAELGESFNISNSLFSGGALLGVLYTINLQTRDIESRFKLSEQQYEGDKRDLMQALLMVRLQATQQAIDEGRRAIIDLVPFIEKLPASPSKLLELQFRLRQEINRGRGNHDLEAALVQIDEVVGLTQQLKQIRAEIEIVYAETAK